MTHHVRWHRARDLREEHERCNALLRGRRVMKKREAERRSVESDEGRAKRERYEVHSHHEDSIENYIVHHSHGHEEDVHHAGNGDMHGHDVVHHAEGMVHEEVNHHAEDVVDHSIVHVHDA
jgi:hypothetical protein